MYQVLLLCGYLISLICSAPLHIGPPKSPNSRSNLLRKSSVHVTDDLDMYVYWELFSCSYAVHNIVRCMFHDPSTSYSPVHSPNNFSCNALVMIYCKHIIQDHNNQFLI